MIRKLRIYGTAFVPTLWVIFFFCGLTFQSEACADVLLIANKNVPENSLSANEVNKMFLGEKVEWDNGMKIIIITMKESKIHDTFVTTFMNKSPKKFKQYWRKMVFTGKGTMPIAFDNEAEIKAYVAKTPGAIGYVSTGTKINHVKLIKISE